MHKVRGRSRLIALAAAAGVAAAGVAGGSACGATGESRSLGNGEHWTVGNTTVLTELRLSEGAILDAPAGRLLTMTVNGVEMPVAPGTYRGSVVLTPARVIDVNYRGMGQDLHYPFRAAVYVDDGAYVPGKSVRSAAVGGQVTSTGAGNVRITSAGDGFNGIFVDGTSRFRIDDPTIRLKGNGVSDFAGFGAAIKVAGHSTVTINHAKIDDTGAVRTGIWVGDNAVAVVNDSDIELHNGTLPADYGWSMEHPPKPGSVMMEVPWPLGILGNARATLLTGRGTVYYNNSRIRSQGWGALAVDGAMGARLFATNSTIETLDSGYGAYADGDVLDTFSHCRFDVADYGLIMGGGSAVFTDHSTVNSRRIGVMAHDMGLNFNNPGLGRLTIEKGTVFNTEKAVIQLKSVSPTILVDGAVLNSRSGVILQAMVNDDPNERRAVEARAAGHGGGPPPLGKLRYTSADGDNDIDATFRNVTLKGDLVNAMTSLSGMNVRFVNAQITGAITTATGQHAVGPHGESLKVQDKPDLYYLIGDETETYGPVESPHGVSVSLDQHSTWTVTRTSWLDRLALKDGAAVRAPAGHCLRLRVDGVEMPIRAGRVYTGKIRLAVSDACAT